MAWLGVIRPHRRDEAWSASLWQTFFAMTVGAQIPAIGLCRSRLVDAKKIVIDALGDHVNICSAHSGAKKPMTGRLSNLLTCFA